ncbi:hypothetical protein LX32DRAFT_218589 [Colletotrichum zoysiae]|uniref:Uncharacterized protein n=1 Tax=Colletotrichum zoysiae TaxID=1216348 RepID=A0AAD9M3W9_9PEZI|nr:hypothetical protein LX32DRAFT_218589 [Colletotrichum zoysiae]
MLSCQGTHNTHPSARATKAQSGHNKQKRTDHRDRALQEAMDRSIRCTFGRETKRALQRLFRVVKNFRICPTSRGIKTRGWLACLTVGCCGNESLRPATPSLVSRVLQSKGRGRAGEALSRQQALRLLSQPGVQNRVGQRARAFPRGKRRAEAVRG